MKFSQFIDVLLHHLMICIMIGEACFIPLLTYVALRGVFPSPNAFFFNIFWSDNSWKNYIIHVTGHWIFQKQIISNFINTHEHQGHLTCRFALLLPGLLLLHPFLDPLNFESILHQIEVISLLLWIEDIDILLYNFTIFIKIVEANIFESSLVINVDIYFLLLIKIFDVWCVSFFYTYFLCALLNLVHKFLDHFIFLRFTLLTTPHVFEDLRDIYFFHYFIDFIIEAQPLLVNIIPLFHKIFQSLIVEIVILQF